MSHMSYWFGTEIGDFLFKGFSITSTAGLISTCFGLASLAIILEAVKVSLSSARHNEACTQPLVRDTSAEGSALLTSNNSIRKFKLKSNRILSFLHQLLLFLSRDIISYLLMLSVMTFNGYFTLSISLGSGVGFFVFGPTLMKIALMRGQRQLDCSQCQGIQGSGARREVSEDTANLLDVDPGITALVCDVNAPAESPFATNNEQPATSTLAVVQVHSTQDQQL